MRSKDDVQHKLNLRCCFVPFCTFFHYFNYILHARDSIHLRGCVLGRQHPQRFCRWVAARLAQGLAAARASWNGGHKTIGTSSFHDGLQIHKRDEGNTFSVISTSRTSDSCTLLGLQDYHAALMFSHRDILLGSGGEVEGRDNSDDVPGKQNLLEQRTSRVTRKTLQDDWMTRVRQ